jgi:histidyl-tRNA synthetase
LSKAIHAVRGMNDLLPEQVRLWQRVEAAARDILHAYGYSEVRFPILERTELFARSIGDVTDIVEKEMYTFEDRSGDSLTLRPEGTAGCVRAGIENGLLHNQVQRLWYQGPMFRHERPQKGRYRQFHQIGVEAFGMAGPDVDAELILICARLWRALGIGQLELQLNSLGSPAARAAYRRVLVDYLESRRGELDDDSIKRLDRNPLRVLDSKNPAMQDVIANAPSLHDHLDGESRVHFQRLREMLEANGVRCTINTRLVRGLDYYTRTVFEWTTDRLGAQSAVCAGGRYDGLVELLGGAPAPAAGFALGLERIVELLALDGAGGSDCQPQVYFALLDERAASEALALAERLRDAGLRVTLNCGAGSLKSQLTRPDRRGARYCALLGGEETARQAVAVKDMRDGSQVEVAREGLVAHLRERLSSN